MQLLRYKMAYYNATVKQVTTGKFLPYETSKTGNFDVAHHYAKGSTECEDAEGLTVVISDEITGKRWYYEKGYCKLIHDPLIGNAW